MILKSTPTVPQLTLPSVLSMSTRVLAAGGAPASDEQRVLGAVLAGSPGAVLHGRSTLAWLGVGTYDLRELHVARPRGITRMEPNLARLHDLRCVRAHDVFVARGVVTETALRAIWSEAGRYTRPHLLDVGAAKIGRLLDIANRRNLLTWHALAESVDGLQRRGRAGTVLMRALAEARPPGSSPTDSRQEDRFEDVLSNAGERGLRRQPHLGGTSRSVAVTSGTMNCPSPSRSTASCTTRIPPTERPTSSGTPRSTTPASRWASVGRRTCGHGLPPSSP